MIKRIISCFLAVSMLFSVVGIVASAAEKENYGYLNAKIIETNKKTTVDVMSIGENIYVNAKFYEQFGFIVEINDGVVVIGNNSDDNIPKGAIGFYFNNAKCRRINNAIGEEYQAPFKSVKNTKGAWIPFEYSLTMLNGSVLTDKKGDVFISSPKQSLLDVLNGIAVNQQNFIFDYAKDFGYGKGSQHFGDKASHFVNVYNGLLKFDGASWATYLLSSSEIGSLFDDSPYNIKYGSNVARMVCTNSDEELMDEVEKVSTINEFFSEDGALADILSDLRKSNETEIGELYKESQEILKNIKKTNGDVSEYNRVYSKLENALKKSDFMKIGDVVSDFQKASKTVTKGLTLVAAVAETVSYYTEFTNRDLFAVSSLELMIGEMPVFKGELSLTTKGAMLAGAKAFRADAASYTIGRFLMENIDEVLSNGIKLCTSANIALLAWNLISSFVPFVSEGLSAADKYELSVYALCLQAEANKIYNQKLVEVLSSNGNMTESDLKELSMYAYAYLKICYVTRNAAIAGMYNPTKEEKESAKITIEQQKGVNSQIVPLLNLAKTSVNADAYACLGLCEPVLNVDSLNITEDKIATEESKAVPTIDSFYQDLIKQYGETSQKEFVSYEGGTEKPYPTDIYGLVSGIKVDLNNDKIEELIVTRVSETEHGIEAQILVEIYRNNGKEYVLADSEPVYYISNSSAAHMYLFYSDALSGYCIVVDSSSEGTSSVVDSWAAKVFSLLNFTIEEYGKWEYVPMVDKNDDMKKELSEIGAPYAKYCADFDNRNDSVYYQPLCEIEHEIFGDSGSYLTRNHKLKIIDASNNQEEIKVPTEQGNIQTSSEEDLFKNYIKDNLTINNSKDPQKDGVFNVLVKDFDGDNSKEMVTFSLLNDEHRGGTVTIDLYVVKNGVVQLSDSSDEMYCVRVGAYGYVFCATTEGSEIKISSNGLCSGGSQRMTNYITFEVYKGSLNQLNHYYSYIYPRYERCDYIEKVSNKKFDSSEGFYSAVKDAGYDSSKHLHFNSATVNGLNHADLGGDHIFTIVEDDRQVTEYEVYEIYNNTNFIDMN